MKSIANQYRDLKEGRMSQANFMRNLRMSMPQYITNVTSFNDAVKILKSKSILTESMPGREAELRQKYLNDVTSQMENGDSYAEAIAKVAAENDIDEDALANMVPEQSVGDKAYADNYNEIYEEDDDAEVEDIIAKAEEEESGKYTKFQDVPGAISEGKGKELHPNQIHPQELRMGIRVEMEHTDDPKKAEKIALDHLAENPYYYTALKLSGVDTKVEPTKEKKVKKKAKKQDLVDKENQMKKVKVVKEARYNISGEPNAAAEQAMKFVDGNATLKALSDDIEIQQSQDDAILRYQYWKPLPPEAVEKLKLQFKVELIEDFDEDTGNIIAYRLTPLRGKAEKYRAFQSKLEALVKEVMAEYYDGRDNLIDDIAAKQESLTPDEQKVVDDILETLQEGMFDKGKFVSYLKKGLVTMAVLGALLGSTQLNFDQKKDIVDTVKIEKTADQDIKDVADAKLAISYYNMNKDKVNKAAENDFDLQQVVKGINNITSQKAENNNDVLKSFGKNYKSQIEKLIKVN